MKNYMATVGFVALSARSKKIWQDHRETLVAALTTDEIKLKKAKARALQPRSDTLPQRQLYAFLDDLGVTYHKEGENTRIGYYVFDCAVPLAEGKLLAIETHGDYWHQLPRVQQNDKSKFTFIERYHPHVEIMYIWEYEFGTAGRVLDRLKLKLGLDIQTVDFEISDVNFRSGMDYRDVSDFLATYHYIGKDRTGTIFGAYLKDELVAVSVFSKPIRQNMGVVFGFPKFLELSRLCIHPSYHKKNFASWFVGRCLRKIELPVVSYADTTVGHTGAMYMAANFKLHHEVAPDYWYVDKDGYVMHKRTLYGKAVHLHLKEAEFAEKYGYEKRWGGKKLCFIYDRKSKYKARHAGPAPIGQ